MIDCSAFAESLNGKPVAVFGLGVSGQATVRALEAAGIKVIAADDETPDVILDEETLASCACLILSPGVPLYHPAPHPVVTAARAAGTEIICDIELFGRIYPNAKTIGITGTNGKSTSAVLLHHVLQECGVISQLGGNIGRAVMDLNAPTEDEVIVLELSSYQLDLCPTFSPDISVLLNITPDHLDRHGSMDNYVSSKAHIFEGPGTAVIATDDGFTKAIAATTQSKGAREVMCVSAKDINFETRALCGAHNKQNIAAVMAVANVLELGEGKVRAAIESFPGLPHRQFLVREIDGVIFINDSKATNVEATSKALAAFDDIYWIVGGQAKEGGLNGLESYVTRITHAFLIGQSSGSFASWLTQNDVDFTMCDSLEHAVKAAHTLAQSGATVLLSPVCASWDQFKSFEDRGEQFAVLVNAL